jgi:hypothetical protein
VLFSKNFTKKQDKTKPIVAKRYGNMLKSPNPKAAERATERLTLTISIVL